MSDGVQVADTGSLQSQMPPVTQHVRTDTAPAMLYKITTVAAAITSLQLFE